MYGGMFMKKNTKNSAAAPGKDTSKVLTEKKDETAKSSVDIKTETAKNEAKKTTKKAVKKLPFFRCVQIFP